jgi:PAS domain S-box-containing protein
MTTLLQNTTLSVKDLWNFFNHSISLFSILGSDGYLKAINPAFSNLLGGTEEELFSTHYTDFVHPEHQEAAIREMDRLKMGTPVISFKTRLVTASGDYRWVALSGSPSIIPGLIYITGEDITAKKKIEEEMEWLALIADKTKHGITITDKNEKIIWVNQGFSIMTGYPFEETIGKNPSDLLNGPLTSKDSNDFIASQMERREHFFRETINYKKNGEPFWKRVEGQPLFDENGEVTKWVLLQTDISNKKAAEESIITNEKKYRSIFYNSPLFNFIYDPNSLKILEVNAAAISHYGYSLEEFMHLTIREIKTETNPADLQLIFGKAQRGTFQGICKHKKKNGEIIIADETASSIEYKNNTAVLLIIKDITENTRLQEELIKERLNKEKNLLEATLRGQELERVEIGKELHDNINQMLGSVKLYNEMALSNKKRSEEFIRTSINILLTTINEIRGLSKTLVASGDEQFNLFESVHNLTETITHAKEIQIDFFINKKEEELPSKIKLMFYRIIQEQLNNILKHAASKIVNIELVNNAGNIKLIIQDDGNGFDTSKYRNGVGLNNIISRAKLYNGTVNIYSKPGQGCLLEITIPCDGIPT